MRHFSIISNKKPKNKNVSLKAVQLMYISFVNNMLNGVGESSKTPKCYNFQ